MRHSPTWRLQERGSFACRPEVPKSGKRDTRAWHTLPSLHDLPPNFCVCVCAHTQELTREGQRRASSVRAWLPLDLRAMLKTGLNFLF